MASIKPIKTGIVAILAILVFFIFLASLSETSYSFPQIASEYYGRVYYYDQNSTPFPAGTLINAYVNNISCGNFTTSLEGYYGLISCLGDDLYTNNTEGGEEGEGIIFYINGREALGLGDDVWYEGGVTRIDIYPIPVCGDGLCNIGESCSTCPDDCNICVEEKKDAGGGAQGGSGSQSTSSSSSSAAQQRLMSLASFQRSCTENWKCADWEPKDCPISGKQTRKCTDSNNCRTLLHKPMEEKTCVYKGTCVDQIQNQDETDVDCGGKACPSCTINLKCFIDKHCSSGFCNPLTRKCQTPTCTDGFQNQGEDGIDCGGPCEPCPEKLYAKPFLERPLFQYRHCGTFPYVFVFTVLLFTAIIYASGIYYAKWRKSRLRHDESDRQRLLKRLYYLKRDLLLFVIISVILTLIIALYLYFLCGIYVHFLIVILVLIPTITYLVLLRLEYSEARSIKRTKMLIKTHEEQLIRFISVENKAIEGFENEILRLIGEYTKTNTNEISDQLGKIGKEVEYVNALRRGKSEHLNLESNITKRIVTLLNDNDVKKHTSNELLNQLLIKLKSLSECYSKKREAYEALYLDTSVFKPK